MFWKRKKEAVPATFEDRLTLQEQKISDLKREVVSLNMDNTNLRDKVLKKIQQKRKIDIEDDPKPPADGLPRFKDDG